MTRRPAPDVLRWCQQLGLSGIGEVRDLVSGRSGARVVSVATSDGTVVVKITADPDHLDRARREVDVLRRLGARPTPCAPILLAATATDEGVALALTHGEPLPPAQDLTDGAWEEIALAIASVHRPLIDSVHEVVERHSPGPLPAVLEHGDCHLDNLVRDATGRVVLIDWQEARLGDGLADLVFTWQRAEFIGARPPREAMTAAYAAARGIDLSLLGPLLDRVELRLLREAWPPFLALGDDAGRASLADRLAVLTAAEPPTVPT